MSKKCFSSPVYSDKDLITVRKISIVLYNVCIVMECYIFYRQHASSSFVLVYYIVYR